MQSTAETPRSILKRYADALIANAQADTEEDLDRTSDDLIEIMGSMEEHSEEVAQLIYELLNQDTEATAF